MRPHPSSLNQWRKVGLHMPRESQEFQDMPDAFHKTEYKVQKVASLDQGVILADCVTLDEILGQEWCYTTSSKL